MKISFLEMNQFKQPEFIRILPVGINGNEGEGSVFGCCGQFEQDRIIHLNNKNHQKNKYYETN
jgi:hypothetical protein